MWQDLLRIPLPFNLPVVGDELVIHGFGLMLVIGFLAAMELARFLARRSGIDPEVFANAAVLALITGILGARLSHVLENLPDYTRADRTFFQNLSAAANITSGGLTYYGGFLLAFPTLLIYGRMRKIPLRVGMDIVAPCLIVGLAFGRIGCFLNGCCYGAACELPWAMSFPYGSPAYVDDFDAGRAHPPPQLLTTDSRGRLHLVDREEFHKGDKSALAAIAAQQRSHRVHPAQLYSAFTAFLLAAALVAHFTMPHAPGRTFAIMLILEGMARFSLELVRSEPAVIGNFSFSMAMSIPLVLLGIVLWIVFGKLAPKKSSETFGSPMSATAAAAT
jgi:phosphatidylglycerol:prolipoprotein diacylglycerol transferase